MSEQKKRRKFSEEEIIYLKENYSLLGSKLIAKYLNRTRSTIISKAQRLNIKVKSLSDLKSKYILNKYFFDKPNICNSYWAGFIAADGCVFRKQNVLRIELSQKDAHLLEILKNHLNYTKNVKYYQRIKNNKIFNHCSLVITNAKYIIDTLKNVWNITERKSLTLKPPKLKKLKHIYAWIIGFLDGDGCVCFNKKISECSIGFVGTYQILDWIKFYITKLIPKRMTCEKKISKYIKIYQIHWCGKKAKIICKKLLSIVDIPWRLNRKTGKNIIGLRNAIQKNSSNRRRRDSASGRFCVR